MLRARTGGCAPVSSQFRSLPFAARIKSAGGSGREVCRFPCFVVPGRLRGRPQVADRRPRARSVVLGPESARSRERSLRLGSSCSSQMHHFAPEENGNRNRDASRFAQKFARRMNFVRANGIHDGSSCEYGKGE